MDQALLVGINAYPAPNTLYGCVNDIVDVAARLEQGFGFGYEGIVTLLDGSATRGAILAELEQIIAGLSAGDRFLFYFSGHGVRYPVTSAGGTESVIEALCPVDFSMTGDDAVNGLVAADFAPLFARLPPKVEFVWCLDACYSAGLLPMAFTLKHAQAGRHKTWALPPGVAARVASLLSEAPHRRSRVYDSAGKVYRVGVLAACAADQLATDGAFPDGAPNARPNGAFTYWLLQQLATDPASSLEALADALAAPLERYQQTPRAEGDEAIVQRKFLTL